MTTRIDHVTRPPADDVINATCHHKDRGVVYDVTSAAASHRCDVNAYEYVDLTQLGAVRAMFVAIFFF